MSSIHRQLERLFRHGTHAGLTDGELLERFVAGPEEAASAAFGTLVERHGPMVLRVCRRGLDDAHEAEDAAQAVFLVLARKARGIRRKPSVASWLFGVAVRVARKARGRNSRRRRHERRGAEMAARANAANHPPTPDEERPWADLYDELERLPERLKAPLVLCYLEGTTNEQAAERLGTSLRTLRRRLAEGRERLKSRLERRGVGPAAALASTLAPESARSGVVPAAWAERTVHLSLEFAARGAATGAAATMAQEVITSMFTTKLQLAAAATALTGAVALAGFYPPATGPEEIPHNPPPPVAPDPDPSRAVPVTLDGTPLPDFVTDRPRTHPGRTIQVQILAAETGAPVPNATVLVRIAFNDYWTTTDENGRLAIEHSTGPADRYVYVDVWGDGLAMQRHYYGRNEEPIPDEATISLQPGTTLGGIIQDEQGRPVEGATVYLWSHNFQRKAPRELIYDLRATSGPDGRWRTDSAPEPTGDLIGMYITHPDFISDRQYQGGRKSPPIEELKAGTTISVLATGPRIEGRVVDAAGEPVAGALVLTTTERVTLFDQVKDFAVVTDDQGRFRTGQLAPGDWHILARAPGHGPAAQVIKVATANPQVELRLGPPHAMRLRVVDPEGEPIEAAFLPVEPWRRYQCLGVYLWTDADGRATWEDAPGDQLFVNASRLGYLSKYEIPVEPTGEEELVIKLAPSLTIAGTVLDAETREQIRRADVEVGRVDPVTGAVAEWSEPDEARLMASSGRLDVGVVAASAPLQLRITAPGYEPFITRTFGADEREVAGYEVLLAPADATSRTATATSSDGTPMANARVAVGNGRRQSIGLENGALVPDSNANPRELRTDADGTFPIPALGDEGLVFLADEIGYAYATKQALDETPSLQARPFARVTGRFLVGDRPGANLGLRLEGLLFGPEMNNTQISTRHKTTTDAEGRFVFERVIPTDDLRISREYFYGVPGSVWSNGEVVRVEPGQTVDITYGGTGRPIVGRIAPPVGWEQPVDFTEQTHVSLWQDRPYTPIPPELFRDQTDPYGQYQRDWVREWASSPEGRAYRDEERRYSFTLAPDGSFRVDDLAPGAYRLTAYVGEEYWAMSGPFAPLSHYFEIPPIPGGRTDEPLDLGLMRLRPRTRLEIGQEAPEVEVVSTDGEAISIPSDYRGRYLLLDFGSASEYGSRTQIARVNGLQALPGQDRLAVVSLLVDDDNEATRAFIAAKGQDWPQAIIGRFPNPVVEAYAVEDQGNVISSVMQLILIGPDGKVLGRGRSGQEVEKILTEAP